MLGATIVAEVSCNYPAPEGASTLSQLFEEVIGVNEGRGYVLRDWQLSRVVTGGVINETIVAVFTLTELHSLRTALLRNVRV